MRLIGTIPDAKLVERFQNFLIADGTKCSVEESEQGYAVWVHDDDRVETSRAQLAEFLVHPEAEKFISAKQRADAVLREEAERRKVARRQTVNARDQWRTPTAADFPFTLTVIILCVGVFAETYLMGDPRNIQGLLLFSTDATWRAIGEGQWWRILTPAIMHGGPLHIFFNLLWWWDLGRLVEFRKGTFKLLSMSVAIAAFSNTLQFEFGHPWFLGLSGVVFGLFGYVWVKGKLDPGDGIGISDQSAMWMMVWFLICVFQLVGGVANWAHFGGLLAGIVFAFTSIGWRRLQQSRRNRPS